MHTVEKNSERPANRCSSDLRNCLIWRYLHLFRWTFLRKPTYVRETAIVVSFYLEDSRSCLLFLSSTIKTKQTKTWSQQWDRVVREKLWTPANRCRCVLRNCLIWRYLPFLRWTFLRKPISIRETTIVVSFYLEGSRSWLLFSSSTIK